MPASSFGFAPPDYSDWANLAGFDRTTGQIADSSLAQAAGIKPPSSLEDLAKLAVSPYQDKFDKLQTAFGQASQGNVAGAYSTMKQKPTTQTQPASSGYDFSENPH